MKHTLKRLDGHGHVDVRVASTSLRLGVAHDDPQDLYEGTAFR